MNDLAEALRAQAAVSHPRANFDDVLMRTGMRRKRTVMLRVLAAITVVVMVGAVAVIQRDGGDRVMVARASRGLPGLVIGTYRSGRLDRRDSTAEQGPWTVIVRRAGGSLAVNGAVITFPVADLTSEQRVTVNGSAGRFGAGQIVWPIAGAYARVRGDVGETQLLEIARRTSVVAGRPTVRPPNRFSVVFAGPYRAPLVQEARYGSASLGEGNSLGDGLTYTGVLRAGGFEDQLYARTSRRGSRAHGHPAVISSVQGGNDTLAWELSPGLIAYVGYSGNSLTDQAAQALTRLAERSRLITPNVWQKAHPQVVEQPNDFGG